MSGESLPSSPVGVTWKGREMLARIMVLLAIFWSADSVAQSDKGSGDAGRVGPRVKDAVWGPESDPDTLRSGDIVKNPAGESRVIAAGRFRPELWKVDDDNGVVDVGYFVVAKRKNAVRIEWEKSPAVEWSVLLGGVLPWKRTGKRFDAFRLTDWLVERGQPVGLPFFGRENVAFRFGKDGVLQAALKEGGEASGRWWWSKGRLHLEIEGLDDIGTYEWKSLVSRVGWGGEETVESVKGPVVEPLAAMQRKTAKDRVLARARQGCPRDVLHRLLAEAAERSDVVSAIAIEKETIGLCAERQTVVADLLKAEGQIEDALGRARERRDPRKGRKGIKSVAQLVGLKVGETAGEEKSATGKATPQMEIEVSAELPHVDEGTRPEVVAPEKVAGRAAEPAKKSVTGYRWFSLVGRKGALVAGVTDGRRVWFVGAGDVLPGNRRVENIRGRPPGVRVAGLGLLPWAGKSALERVSTEAASREESEAHPPTAVAEAPIVRLSGKARVLDGDTLELAGARVRLWGIDAPETRQRCRANGQWWSCGGLATAALRSRSSNVRCERRGRDAYGRVLGVCFERGEDINGWLVSEGWAVAYRRYARDYVADEERAKAQRKGIHRGEFVNPWDWRRGVRLKEGRGGEAADANKGGVAREALPALPGEGAGR